MTSKPNCALIIMVASILLTSCNSKPSDTSAAQAPSVETDFVELKAEDANTQVSYPGSIEGTVNVDIKPQVSGYLETVLVKEGDYVQKGQSLFKIRPEVYNEQVNNSSAALKATLANQATAKVELEKIKPLVAGKVVSEIQLKSAQAAYDAATAQVEQAKSALGSSKINANFTLIKAPVSGYIGRIPNRIGSLVTPSDATPLTTLSEINNISVYFSMTEADFIALEKHGETLGSNRQVELLLADGSIYKEKGRLETASGNIDRSTGSIAMKAVFPNPNKLLRSGGTAKVIIGNTVKNVMLLPKLSVKDIQDKFFVYKLGDSSNVEMTPIEIEGGNATMYFIKSGVKPGDKIAVNRIDMLQMGVSVKPKIVSIDSLSR